MIKCRRPERFRADLVGEFVDGHAELLEPAPSFVKCSFAAVLGFVEEGGFMVVGLLLARLGSLIGLVGVALVARSRYVVWV